MDQPDSILAYPFYFWKYEDHKILYEWTLKITFCFALVLTFGRLLVSAASVIFFSLVAAVLIVPVAAAFLFICLCSSGENCVSKLYSQVLTYAFVSIVFFLLNFCGMFSACFGVINTAVYAKYCFKPGKNSIWRTAVLTPLLNAPTFFVYYFLGSYLSLLSKDDFLLRYLLAIPSLHVAFMTVPSLHAHMMESSPPTKTSVYMPPLCSLNGLLVSGILSGRVEYARPYVDVIVSFISLVSFHQYYYEAASRQANKHQCATTKAADEQDDETSARSEGPMVTITYEQDKASEEQKIEPHQSATTKAADEQDDKASARSEGPLVTTAHKASEEQKFELFG